jgi:hypothetical protein
MTIEVLRLFIEVLRQAKIVIDQRKSQPPALRKGGSKIDDGPAIE